MGPIKDYLILDTEETHSCLKHCTHLHFWYDLPKKETTNMLKDTCSYFTSTSEAGFLMVSLEFAHDHSPHLATPLL